jgi:hypothetical protein
MPLVVVLPTIASLMFRGAERRSDTSHRPLVPVPVMGWPGRAPTPVRRRVSPGNQHQSSTNLIARLMAGKSVIHIADLTADEGYARDATACGLVVNIDSAGLGAGYVHYNPVKR